jgi:predicted phosphate transport protein (TIGR00153 family)
MTTPGTGSHSALKAVSNLLKGTDHEFFDLFDRAAANVAHAAELLHEMLVGFPDTGGLAEAILECEHVGDQITHDTIRRINQVFVTPIERRDIFELSGALDDIVDDIEEVAAYLGLYRIEAPMTQAEELSEILKQATAEIVTAIALVRDFSDINPQILEVHRLENAGDRVARQAIASLFARGVDPMVAIRWKDIFERLERAIDSAERAANVLEAIVIKNA